MNAPLPITSDDLNALIDNSLAPERQAEVEAGLASDAALRQEYVELRAMTRLLGDLPEYAPRRSFQLGAEHRRPASVVAEPTPITSAPSKVVRLLPLVRQLSVAAALIFMVVAGALFFDINGDTDGGSPAGVTNSADHASEDAEDAADARAADESDEILTERGDAASAGNEPMGDLTALQGDESANTPGVQADDTDRTVWAWTTVGLGVFAIVLAGVWYSMAQANRPDGNRRS
jgi:hypothetical protein